MTGEPDAESIPEEAVSELPADSPEDGITGEDIVEDIVEDTVAEGPAATMGGGCGCLIVPR